jgi:hypothetical protein
MYVFVYVHVSYPEPVHVPRSLRGHWQTAKKPKSLLKGYLCNSPDTLDIWRANCYRNNPLEDDKVIQSKQLKFVAWNFVE